MNISSIDNNNSFGMAWNKAAKPILTEIVADLSKSKQRETVKIINKLGQNSAFFDLRINSKSRYIFVEPQRPELRSFIAYFDGINTGKKFFRALKGIDKFIIQENAALTKREPLYAALASTLDYTKQRGIMEPGIRMFDEYIPQFTKGLAVEMAEKGKTVQNVAKQFKNIDDIARSNNLRVYFINKGISVSTRTNGIIYSNSANIMSLSRLDSLEKFMKLYAAKKNTGEYMKHTFGIFSTKVADTKLRIQLAAIELEKKIKNSKIGKFFASIKEKIKDKVFEKRAKKYLAKQEAMEKISEAIKID